MVDETDNIVETIGQNYKERVPDDLHDARSMEWYLDLVQNEDPLVARNAHQRLADMFDHYGTDYDDTRDIVRYRLMSEDPVNDGKNVFYGSDVHEAIHEFVNKVKGGAKGLGPQKRVLLLLGPVGSGKSDADRQIREYFEHYTSDDNGRMYTFRWTDLCSVIPDQDPADDTVRSPMNQDPLVLVPQEERNEILLNANANHDKTYNLRNDQSPDPESAFYLEKLLEHYDDNLARVFENHVEVIRMIPDEDRRTGIETFEPKDKKNQDETELTGDVNYSKLSVYSESDPRAFDYSGAFCNANRGIFSGEELLKLQREFLYDFLHATQEHTIKPKNNPRIDIDQVIVGRTNMPEYRDKASDDKMEAFNDRTKRVDFPYVKEFEGEAEVYRKILRNADVPDVHIEPHALEMAGLFAVLTRIDEPSVQQIDVLQKAKAYNTPQAFPDIDVRKLKEEAGREAMDGISARFVGDEISEAIMSEMQKGSNSLSALTILENFEEHLDLHASIPEENLSDYRRMLELVRDEYKERAIEDVRSAVAYDKKELMRQGDKYFDHVMAYIDDTTVEDELTGNDVEPDEKFMRSVEKQIGVTEDRKDSFRDELSYWISRRARSGEDFDPTDNDKVRKALEKKIWEDKKHNINFSALVSQDHGDRGEVLEGLKKVGYSEKGAEEVLEFAGADIAKSELEG